MLELAIFAVFGMVFGSFLTVVVHRVPRKESILRPRSRCPSCGTPLRNRDNVPVASWLFLRGRCRACGARISPVYPLLELGSGAMFVLAAVTFDRLFVASLMAPFLALLVALSVIDIRHRIIPNRVVYPSLLLAGAAIGVVAIVGGGVDAARAGIGMIAYGGALLIVALIHPAGLGMGDVKLVALIGLVLGSLGLRFVAVAAAAGIVAGGAWSVAALLLGRAGRKTQIPFGPFLAAGAVVSAFFGGPLAAAYLRTLS